MEFHVYWEGLGYQLCILCRCVLSAMYWTSLVNALHRHTTFYGPLILMSICLNSLYTVFCHTNVQVRFNPVTFYLNVFLCPILVSFSTIQSYILLYSQFYFYMCSLTVYSCLTMLQEHNIIRTKWANLTELWVTLYCVTNWGFGTRSLVRYGGALYLV